MSAAAASGASHGVTDVDMRDLRAKVAGLTGRKVLIVGDTMVDTYVAGQVDRISPEAPVPVVHVDREWELLGGAGNVARNVAALGGAPTLVALAGADMAADRLRDLLARENVRTALVQDLDRPTTVKTRVIAAGQQVCRVDREDSRPVSANIRNQLLERVKAVLEDPDEPAGAVIVSDYCKGVVDGPFMEGLMALVGRCNPRPAVLVDPVPQHYPLYAGVDLVTPNAKEAGAPGGLSAPGPLGGKAGVLRAGLKLFKTCKLKHALVTLGPDGMALFVAPDDVRHLPTCARKVFDVTGAGDTVIAVMGLALAAGLPLLSAAVLANHAAGRVVAEVGAAAVTREQLEEALLASEQLEGVCRAETAPAGETEPPAPVRVERWL